MLYDKVYIYPTHSNFPKTNEELVVHLVIRSTQNLKVIIVPSNSGTT